MPDAIYCYDVACVRFALDLNGRRIVAQIEEDALRDHFGARGGEDDLLQAYHLHESQIRERALRKLSAAEGARLPVWLKLEDFERVPGI